MKIAVVGSINMDMTVLADRIPKKGETVAGSDLRHVPGGKGANQAVAASRLGADTAMYGCVGDDANGEMLLDNLRKQGVDGSKIKVVPGVPSGIAVITVADKDNVIVVVPGANGCVDTAYVDSIADDLRQADMVMLQHEIPQETIEYVIDLCDRADIPVVLNPAPARPVSQGTVNKVRWITPNETEAALIFGDRPIDEMLADYPDKLVITLGSDGTAASDGKAVLHIPARKSEVVDTTGAGDTFNAAFSVRCAAGDSLEDALRYANTAGGLATEKFGAQGGMPSDEDVRRAM